VNQDNTFGLATRLSWKTGILFWFLIDTRDFSVLQSICVSPSLLYSGYRGALSMGWNSQSVKQTFHVHLVPKRVWIFTSPPYMPSWYLEGQPYFCMLYAFFWVIPRHLNFICQCFRTLCLFHLHRQVGAC